MSNEPAQVQAQGFGFGNLFGGVANFFAVETAGAGENVVVPQVEEITETYKPSLKFKEKLQGKSVLLTGATGAVGSAVARKLLKCNLRKLVLFVRDRDNLDPKIMQLANEQGQNDILHIETLDLREPQRIE